MSRIWDAIWDFRGSRLANILVSILILAVGLYDIVIESSIVMSVIGLVFIIIGLLGLYNQFVGESVVSTLQSRSK